MATGPAGAPAPISSAAVRPSSPPPPPRPPMRTAPLVVPGVSTAHATRGLLPVAGRMLGALGMIFWPSELADGTLPDGGVPPELSYPSVPDGWFRDLSRRGSAVEVLIGPGEQVAPPLLVPVPDFVRPAAPGFAPWGDPSVVPFPSPSAPSAPSGMPVRPVRRDLSVGATMSVHAYGPDTVVRIVPYRSPVSPIERQRRDGKYSVELVRAAFLPINLTLGVWSEVQDAVEVFAANLYLRDGRTARAAFRGDMARQLQSFVRGESRLDTLGFGLDFVAMQASDFAHAKVSDLQRKIAVGLGGEAGYRANVAVNRLSKADIFGENDVRVSWIRYASERFRSWDGSRSERVRALWP